METNRGGFLEEVFRVENEIIHESSLTGRVYYVRRRSGMLIITAFGLIAMGLMLIFIFSPNAGEGNQFKSIGIVFCVLGAISVVIYAAWFYNKWRIYQNGSQSAQTSEYIVTAEARPIYEAEYVRSDV